MISFVGVLEGSRVGFTIGSVAVGNSSSVGVAVGGSGVAVSVGGGSGVAEGGTAVAACVAVADGLLEGKLHAVRENTSTRIRMACKGRLFFIIITPLVKDWALALPGFQALAGQIEYGLHLTTARVQLSVIIADSMGNKILAPNPSSSLRNPKILSIHTSVISAWLNLNVYISPLMTSDCAKWFPPFSVDPILIKGQTDMLASAITL